MSSLGHSKDSSYVIPKNTSFAPINNSSSLLDTKSMKSETSSFMMSRATTPNAEIEKTLHESMTQLSQYKSFVKNLSIPFIFFLFLTQKRQRMTILQISK